MHQLKGNFKTIRSYAEAEKYFNTTPARTGKKYKTGRRSQVITERWAENERPLNINNPYLGYTRLIRYDDGDYAFRYHNTNVVTYHKNGKVTIVPYESQSTTTFANHFVPHGVGVSMTPEAKLILHAPDETGPSYYWDRPGQIYLMGGTTVLRPERHGYVIDEARCETQWETPVFDHNLAAEVRKKYRLTELAAYIKTVRGMEQRSWGKTLGRYVIDMVADQASWLELARSGISIKFINRHVFKFGGALQEVKRPYLTSWKDVQNHRAACRRWNV